MPDYKYLLDYNFPFQLLFNENPISCILPIVQNLRLHLRLLIKFSQTKLGATRN